ncbi:MAG: group II intron maturase-specific domain-containing protein, partial [Bacteroidota bacterium]|nr:group II intron maturase-specific domain-containing protein [Bacteroidota bacterium]
TQGFTAAVLIRNLNPVITGWANYHRYVCSKKTFYLLDRYCGGTSGTGLDEDTINLDTGKSFP